MTRPPAKPKKHPTFTRDELMVMRRALANDRSGKIMFPDPLTSALEKIKNAIAYRDAEKTKQQRERYG